jgi:hypothetical protein
MVGFPLQERRNKEDNVSKWSDSSTQGLLFQLASGIKSVCLVHSGHHHHPATRKA